MSTKSESNKDLLELQLGELLESDSKGLVARIFQSGLEQLDIGDHLKQADRQAVHQNGHEFSGLSTKKDHSSRKTNKISDEDSDTPVVEHYQRSEKALMIALAEAYVEGVSTRKMKKETEKLLGKKFSSSSIGRFTSEVDSELVPWRERPIERFYPYLLLDAQSKKCRLNGKVIDITVQVAFGINDVGYRHVLAVEAGWGEPEKIWSEFIGGLKQRGLSGVELFTSNSYSGIQAALQEHFPNAYWQHCQYHFLKDALEKVPKSREDELTESLEQVWHKENTSEKANVRLADLIEELSEPLPQVAAWLNEQAPATLSVFKMAPEAHRRRLRTTYNIERLRKKLKKRTKPVRIFPNPESCLRLFGALLKETHEDWLGSGWRYMKMRPRKEFREKRGSILDIPSKKKQQPTEV